MTKRLPLILAALVAIAAHGQERYTFPITGFSSDDGTVPADSIHRIGETCLVTVLPPIRHFEGEESDEANVWFTAMDDWLYYAYELGERLKGMGVERVYAKQRYLSFELTGGETIVVDTEQRQHGPAASEQSPDGHTVHALLYRRGRVPLLVNLIPLEEDIAVIEEYLRTEHPTAHSGGPLRKTVTDGISDFVGEWNARYVRDPNNLADDLINYSFDLDLHRSPTAPDSLYGWHCSAVRGGRKIDCVVEEAGNPPSILGRLRGDTLHVSYDSSWTGMGRAKLYFSDRARRALVWEMDDPGPYMPLRDTLYETPSVSDILRVRLRDISREEYAARRAAAPPRHAPYRVVTDSVEAERMLRGRARFVAPTEDAPLGDIEITCNDGTQRRLGIPAGSFGGSFVAWYPDLDVAVFTGEDGSDHAVDLADSRREQGRTGNPAYHVTSPDGRWRISGWYNNAASWVYRFVERQRGARSDIERWRNRRSYGESSNGERNDGERSDGERGDEERSDRERGNVERFDFVGDLAWFGESPHRPTRGWVWTNNITVLFEDEHRESYYEMTLIEQYTVGDL